MQAYIDRLSRYDEPMMYLQCVQNIRYSETWELGTPKGL